MGKVQRKIVVANPGDKGSWRHTYILWFGGAGTTYILAYASSLDDALEEAADWIADHAPGLFCDEYVADEYKRAKAEGLSDEKAAEEAMADVTTLDRGHYLLSYEWGIVAEDPSTEQIKHFAFNDR